MRAKFYRGEEERIVLQARISGALPALDGLEQFSPLSLPFPCCWRKGLRDINDEGSRQIGVGALNRDLEGC